MTSIAHSLVPVAGDVWRGDNTAARVVSEAPSTADNVVAEALIRGSDGAALTTTSNKGASGKNDTESGDMVGGRGW